MSYRSQEVLKIPEWSPIRNLYKSMGYTNYDLERPMIGIANSWNRVVPGHYNLQLVSEYVKQGIFQAGGTPVEFGVIAACDGIANGHEGMRYVLPSRDLIANDIEIMVEAHRLDAVVLLGSCDKIVPAMLMAAARLDLPAIIVAGGPTLGGCEFDGRQSDNSSIAEALGMLKAGRIDEAAYRKLEDTVAPTCGSCAFMGTANSMCSVAEAMGMSLPGSAAIPAVYAERLHIAQESGRAIMNLVQQNITARHIINEKGLENALRVAMAIGASTNIALHIPAIGYEADCEISQAFIGELSRTTPHLAKVFPSGKPNVPDYHDAGGVPAVMKELGDLIHQDVMTVSGKPVRENLVNAGSRNHDIIRPRSNPWSPEGGLAVLQGNLAPKTGITKPAAIHPSMRKFTGKARCFDSEELANDAILEGKIKDGDVVVIRYEGPKGGPGMREMTRAMKMLYGRGLALKTALVTDGRFSGTNNGCFVGHISPEAAEGGPIAVVQDGDTITIDVPNRRLHLHVSDEEIAERLKTWQRPDPTITKGYLALYSRLAESADQGAIVRHK